MGIDPGSCNRFVILFEEYENWLTTFRSCEASDLCYVLRHSLDVLWSPNPYHAGSLHDGKIFHQETCGILEISPSYSRYEHEVSRCDC